MKSVNSSSIDVPSQPSVVPGLLRLLVVFLRRRSVYCSRLSSTICYLSIQGELHHGKQIYLYLDLKENLGDNAFQGGLKEDIAFDPPCHPRAVQSHAL